MQGFQTIIDDCKEFHAELGVGIQTFKRWLKLKPGAATKVPIHCCKCGDTVMIFINNVHKNKAMKCSCCVKRAWSTKAAFEQLDRLIQPTRFVPIPGTLDWAWWKRTRPSGETKIPLVCTVCKYQIDTSVHTFVKTGGSAACWCNHRAPYATEAGRLRLLEVAVETRFEPTGWMLDANEWASKNVQGCTHLPLKCVDCSMVSQRCRLDRFIANESAHCDCRWKTERMVREWCVAEFGADAVVNSFAFDDCASAKGFRMPYDITIVRNDLPILIVEVDGPQHFERRHDHRTIENDIAKELDAMRHGVPMIRLHQNSVWHGRFAWQTIMQHAAQQVLQLPVQVYCHPVQHYQKGEYARMRRGTSVQV
jgi:hypothetical protein